MIKRAKAGEKKEKEYHQCVRYVVAADVSETYKQFSDLIKKVLKLNFRKRMLEKSSSFVRAHHRRDCETCTHASSWHTASIHRQMMIEKTIFGLVIHFFVVVVVVRRCCVGRFFVWL